MDFFGSQDLARRNTRRLVVLFALAVVAVVAAVYLAAVALLLQGGLRDEVGRVPWWRPELAAAVSAITLTVIAGGSLYKTAALARGGGEGVASLLGGRPVAPDSEDPAERRLLNVVEEMTLAAGMPVPTVYLLDRESAINAFAAGLGRDDAVIAVTRGCLEQLTRSELQGVIGHETSHLLNGDTRLNLRLMGLLHGILVIAFIGYWILRGGGRAGSSERRGKGGGVVLFGLALLVIGWVGVFFGRLIKSAVSRQREFLADAAAVQFTRDPSGIAGALQKIGGTTLGSLLASPRAEEASHLYFANGVGGALLRWTATHPPLAERIRRLDPRFDGEFPRRARPSRARQAAEQAGTSYAAAAGPAAAAPDRLALDPAALPAAVGNPGPLHVAHAAAFLAGLPPALDRRVREPAAARAVMLALLLDGDEEVRRLQLAQLADDPALRAEVAAVAPELAGLSAAHRLPLVDLALPALRQLSAAQYAAFRSRVEGLVRADRRLSLFEYALHRVLLRHLDPWFAPRKGPPVAVYSLQRLGEPCAVLLSALAHVGHDDPAAAAAAFAAAAAALAGQAGELALLPPGEVTFRRLDEALQRLEGVHPRRRRDLLSACAATVAHDRTVTVREGELLRAVADALDCPLPPLL